MVGVQTIATVIEAYAAGDIELEPVPKDTRKDHIFVAGNVATGAATYTLSTVARFLNWTAKHGDQGVQPTGACRMAFDAYREAASTAEALGTVYRAVNGLIARRVTAR